MIRTALLTTSALALTIIPMLPQASAEELKASGSPQFVTDQPSGEWLARHFVNAAVLNPAGETVGEVSDLVFDRAGHISTVVLGVGGFLGIGEKNVGVPFGALTYSTDKDGARVINVSLSKDALKQAPDFKATEKTTLDKMKDKAVDLGTKASDKVGEIKDQATKKVEDMSKDAPKTP